MKIIGCLLAVLLLSCNEILPEDEDYSLVDDSPVFKHIPHRSMLLNLAETNLYQFERDLGLYNISGGYDSAQLRIWIIDEPDAPGVCRLICIRKFRKGEAYKLTTVHFSYQHENAFTDYDNLTIHSVTKSKIAGNVAQRIMRLAKFGEKVQEDINKVIDTCKRGHPSPRRVLIEFADSQSYFMSFYPTTGLLKQYNCTGAGIDQLRELFITIEEELGLQYVEHVLKE